MKSFIAITLLITAFALPSAEAKKGKSVPHVTGIGGVFFKAKGDPKVLTEWYRVNLGMVIRPGDLAVFKWPEDKAEDKGATAWKLAESDSQWFAPSDAPFMINYRVHDLAGMIANMKKNGVRILKEIEHFENGDFASVLDPDGNRVELWEPKIWNDKNKRP